MSLFVPALAARQGTSLINTLRNLSLTTNLRLCLDAGDPTSYDGSSQTWKDLSGGGYDFYRGSGSGSDAADPTFSGTAGRESSGEYFSSDGGDYFTLAQSNPTWVNDLHKDNAIFTLACWFYSPNVATGITEGLFGDTDFGSASAGMYFGAGVIKDGDIGIEVAKGAGSDGATTTATISSATWTFLAVSLNETTASLIFQINATQETKSFSYSSPLSSAAPYAAKIGDIGDASRPIRNGGRLQSSLAWGGTALSTTQLSSLFQATRAKFGV